MERDWIMRQDSNRQKGSVLVLVAVSITLFFLMFAFALDYGWMILARSELQAAADSAALAGAAKLADEDIVMGQPDQLDDITSARDFAEQFAGVNSAANRFLLLDRNDNNEVDGGVVVGYIDDPLDLNSAFETSSVSQYNSVEVRTSLTHALNGPLALFLGGVTGSPELEMSAQATATVDDRIVGFMPSSGDNLMMLPFAAYEDTWYQSIDGSGDVDNFRVVNGVVSSGADGIPEITLYPYRDSMVIPGIKGNVGTLFICGRSSVSTTTVNNHILYGISLADVVAAGELKLTENGSGEFTRWTPGESWMSSTWHYSLRNIRGQSRVIPLFRGAVNSQTAPITLGNDSSAIRGGEMPEVCCGIYQHYEIVEFKAVTVVDSQWPSSDYNKRWTVQPAQVMTDAALVDSSMPHSGLVYSLSLTR